MKAVTAMLIALSLAGCSVSLATKHPKWTEAQKIRWLNGGSP